MSLTKKQINCLIDNINRLTEMSKRIRLDAIDMALAVKRKIF